MKKILISILIFLSLLITGVIYAGIEINQGSEIVKIKLNTGSENTKLEIGQSYDLLNPILWYKLDANADDEQGNQDGTNIGATRTQGKSGGAFNFDGNDQVSMPDNPIFDFSGRQAFTLSAWVNTDDGKTDTTRGIASRMENSFNGFSLAFNANRYEFNIWNNPIFKSLHDNVLVSGWVHLVGVSDGTTAWLYKNGVEVDTENDLPELTDIVEPFCLGRYYCGTNNFFMEGNIDDVRLYDYDLTPQQVKDLYNSTK